MAFEFDPGVCRLDTCAHAECRKAHCCQGVETLRLSAAHFRRRGELLQRDALIYNLRVDFTIRPTNPAVTTWP